MSIWTSLTVQNELLRQNFSHKTLSQNTVLEIMKSEAKKRRIAAPVFLA